MGEKSVEVVKGIYEAFGRGDVPAVLTAMADDIEWYEAEGMPYGGLHHGPDAAAQNVLGPLAQDIPHFAATPEELIPSGDTVAVVAHDTGTGKATGKELDLRVVHVWAYVMAGSRGSGSSRTRRSSSRSCRRDRHQLTRLTDPGRERASERLVG